MVHPFTFYRTPRILFGIEQFGELFNLTRNSAEVLVITGGKSFKNSEQWQQLHQTLQHQDLSFYIENVSGEPSPKLVDEITSRYRSTNIDLVISIGGGSVLDTGKAVSAMLPNNDSVMDYLEGVGRGKQHDGQKVFFIAIPTTAGTGSEATNNAVLSEPGPEGFKKSLRHQNFVPDIAIVDPLLTVSCPPNLSAASGMDAFTQLLESFVSSKASELTESLGIEAIRKMIHGLPAVIENPSDSSARADVAYAAMISGITIANAGLGAVHGFASSVGGYTEIPHGVVCGKLTAPANIMNIKRLEESDPENRALAKYEQIGKIFAGKEGQSRDFYITAFEEHIKQWHEQFEINRFSEYGLTSNDLEIIADTTSLKNNPVPLSKKDLIAILNDAL